MLMCARYAAAGRMGGARLARSRPEPVLALDPRHPHAVPGIPAVAPESLHLSVLGDALPGPSCGVVGPIGHRDAGATRAPGGFDAEVAGLPGGELLHAHGCLVVTVARLLGLPKRGEHDRDV